MIRIGIILGSTRPGRVGEGVAKWVLTFSQTRKDAEFELVDLKNFNLPLLDEPVPPALAMEYTNKHTREWAKKIASFDAYIFVTPEYNHSCSGALKNAIDYLYKEWNNKAAAFVDYGSNGGQRAVEHLRMIMVEIQVAVVREQLAFSLKTDFENNTFFRPAKYHEKNMRTLLDQLILWGNALKNLRPDKSSETLIDQPISNISERDNDLTNLH